MRRRTLLAITAATLLYAVPGALATPPYGGVSVAVGSSHADASIGTSCTDTADPFGRPASSCSDVAYPLLMHGSVTLKPSRRLRMVFKGRVSSVTIVLRLRREPDSRSVYAARAGVDSRNIHRFKALMPARLPCAALLDILARGVGGGTTDYWTRIHTPGCVPVKR